MEENISFSNECKLFLAFAEWSYMQRQVRINLRRLQKKIYYIAGTSQIENYWSLNLLEKELPICFVTLVMGCMT
jgi:hypothetical protein